MLIGRLQAELALISEESDMEMAEIEHVSLALKGGYICMRAVVFKRADQAVRAKQTKNIHQLLCTSKKLGYSHPS